MQLIAIVCFVGCLALTDASTSTKETGQLLLTLDESHNVHKRQAPLYPIGDLSWFEFQALNATVPRIQYPDIPPQYHKFVNDTLIRVPAGICSTEVPTASLYAEGVHIPRGNGSNPTLSRIRTCCEGFVRNEHRRSKCDPICSKGCANGVCAGPNECICYPDHVKNLAAQCVPTCPTSCDNGNCNRNTCVCNEGFALDKTHKFCIPHCNPPCGNGYCSAPNTCTCNDGYEAIPNGACRPVCPQGCELGECVAPGQCACRAGFKLHERKCVPHCERGCVNGDCVAPNTCTCAQGYTMDPSATRCEAKCEQPCLNGHCDGPNRCKCNSGYQLDASDPFKCVANCPGGCVNAVCSGPRLCLCNAGYVKDRSKKEGNVCIART